MTRKIDKHAKNKSSQHYEALINTANGIIWEVNARNFQFVFVSKQAEDIFGYPVHQWISEPTFWKDHIHPDDREAAIAYCIKCTQEKRAHQFEYRMMAANGKTIWVEDRVSVIVENNIPVLLRGIMIDITQRKEAARTLAENEQRYRNFFEQNLAGVYQTTTSGLILNCNEAFAKMLRYDSARELMQKNAYEFYFSHNQRNEFIKKLRERKKLYNFEIVFKCKDGTALYVIQNVSLHTDTDTGEEYCDGVIIDISERKLAEETAAWQKTQNLKEITEAVITAEENQRSEIGRELHDNVAQLLGTSLLYINIAKTDEKDREIHLNSSSSFTLSAIEEIRKLSKTLITPLIKEMGLTESIKDMIEDIMLVHPIKISFITNDFHEEKLNEKYKLNLFRIVQEQLNNTIKHAKASEVEIIFKETNDHLFISISDDGMGFDASKRQKGVGLSNIDSRTKLYNGVISISSAPGKGCSLSIDFLKSDLILNLFMNIPTAATA